MEFRILGPLEVVREGSVLPTPPNKPRALLALLLLRRGEAVGVDELADDLWGEQPPATATKSIQVYVSQLRKTIGAASDRPENGRDASRLLADASLIVQRTAGVVAEPLLASPGREGIFALAKGAGLLVVGLSARWRREGLGRMRAEIAKSPPAPTIFVRRGPRPGGLAPAESRTRFTWSMTSAGR